MKNRILLILYSTALFCFWGNYSCFSAAMAEKKAKEAERLYQKGDFDGALQKFNEAGSEGLGSDITNFNTGVILYKKEDYQKAIDAFTKALASNNRGIETDALYNIGNCKYKSGKLKENSDIEGAAKLLQESLNYYKRAIETNQKDKNARFNYEFADKELKKLLEKLKNQPPKKEQEQNRQGQKQEERPKENREKDESAQEQQKQEKEQEAKKQQEEKQKEKQETGKQQKQAEENQEKKEPVVPQEEKKELTKEEAEMLLKRYGRDEAIPDYTEKQNREYRKKVLKDW